MLRTQQFIGAILLGTLLLTPALILAQENTPTQSEDPSPVVIPEFFNYLETEEDIEALTEEQKAEWDEFFGNDPEESINTTPPENTVSCFDYFTFGSVQVDLSPTVGSTVSGAPLMFSGTLINENTYPVVEGAVYVKMFRMATDGSVPNNGYDIVDQFVVAENITLAAEENKPFSFVWNVPAYLTSGDYQAAFYYTSAHKFNVSGHLFCAG